MLPENASSVGIVIYDSLTNYDNLHAANIDSTGTRTHQSSSLNLLHNPNPTGL